MEWSREDKESKVLACLNYRLGFVVGCPRKATTEYMYLTYMVLHVLMNFSAIYRIEQLIFAGKRSFKLQLLPNRRTL